MFTSQNNYELPGKIGAHKIILAAASDVFENEFFGSFESEDKVIIVDASQEVFQVMIDYIYNKQPLNLNEYDVNVLAPLYYLADKYIISDLSEKIVTAVAECGLLKIMLTVFKHNESASKFFKDVLKYEIDEPACICSVFRPEDFTEGNYRCVTPGDLIKPLRAAKQILSKGIFWWKTIQLGMDENFYIRIRGCVYKEFEFHIKSEPDVVKYEDEEPDSDDDEYGYETKIRRLDWRSKVICG